MSTKTKFQITTTDAHLSEMVDELQYQVAEQPHRQIYPTQSADDAAEAEERFMRTFERVIGGSVFIVGCALGYGIGYLLYQLFHWIAE